MDSGLPIRSRSFLQFCLFVIFLGFTISACAHSNVTLRSSAPEPSRSHHQAVTPQDSKALEEQIQNELKPKIGVASWYGPGFYGRKTASGARFTKHALTCAHRTLPFGTRLRVTALETGKQVTVIVNDRGPFYRNRLVDLSYAAAKELGLLQKGSGRVEIQTLSGVVEE